MSSEENPAPTIKPSRNGPYLVTNFEDISNSKGAITAKRKMALCRCGQSSKKPFCDGAHAKVGFNSDKSDDRVRDKRENYKAEEVTIHDNRGICAHIGYCSDGLPAVFRSGQEPWIDAKAASGDAIVATIRRCPSGALSYSRDGVEHRDRDGDPAIYVSPNGPYMVTGGPDLLDTERGEGASTEHYTLCRCGGSKNKPFCDGTHCYIDFTDDQN